MVLTPNDDYFDVILKSFEKQFKEAIKVEMQLGQSITLESAKDSGIENTSLSIDQGDIDIFEDQLFLHLKDANRDLSKQISNTVLNNNANRGSNIDLANSLKELFNNQEETYKNRYKTIARDQSSNILNISGRNKALDLGANKKYISTILDRRRCHICDASQDKYGEEDKAIDVGEEFSVTVKGKTYTSNTGKLHVSCRCISLYIFE